MSSRARAAPDEAGAGRGAPDGSPSLAAGFLAALPLFLAYELGLFLGPMESSEHARASAERVVARSLALLGERLQGVRVALLLAVAIACYVRVRRNASGAGAAWRVLGRGTVEGLLAGFLLGPALVLLQGWLAAEPLASAGEPARTLRAVLRLVGAAPWEELLFRVALYGGLFLLARRTLEFLGLAPRLTSLPAELVALLGSSLLFAAFHLEGAQHLLGTSGEPFHAGLFLWRLSAGVLLGGLFRWRGFGVAAWAHALFNLGVALGIRP